MRLHTTIPAILGLFGSAEAFFPYIPPYFHCSEDGQCFDPVNSRRDVSDEVSAVASFKLVQRVPKIEVSREERINLDINKFRRKFSRASPVDDATEDNLAKRTNSHSVMTAANPTQSMSAGLDQDGTDFSYFAELGFGSANTPLYMLLDTGASTTWVMGPDCHTNACKTHDFFGAINSTTYKTSSDSFFVAYGAGNVSGVLASDTVSLAGLKFQMTFGIANNTSTDFENFPIDGILGLSLAKSSTPSFVDTLVASKALKSNIFGMSFNRASDGPNTGEINFGAPDTSKFTGNLNYVNVAPNDEGDWAIPMGNVGFGNTQSGITTKLAYIDSGTSFIFCPPDQAATLYGVVKGAKIQSTGTTVTYSVPCDTATNLTFTFDSNTYSVLPKDWISGSVNGVCTGNVFGHTVVLDAWLLGDTFLKNVYTVFDIDKNRIGFAEKAIAAASTSTTVSGTSKPTSGTLVSSGTSPQSTATGSSQNPTTTTPGMSTHETSGSSGTAVAETTNASATPTKKSSAARFDSNLVGMALPALAFALF